MEAGILWFDDNDKKPMETKINEGARYIYYKYSVRVGTVLVHPSALGGKEKLVVGGITVFPHKTVQPNNFLMGGRGMKAMDWNNIRTESRPDEMANTPIIHPEPVLAPIRKRRGRKPKKVTASVGEV